LLIDIIVIITVIIGPLIGSHNQLSLVFSLLFISSWRSWLGCMTHKIISEITYVTSGMLNSIILISYQFILFLKTFFINLW